MAGKPKPKAGLRDLLLPRPLQPHGCQRLRLHPFNSITTGLMQCVACCRLGCPPCCRAGSFRKEIPAFAERWVYRRGVPHITAGFLFHRCGVVGIWGRECLGFRVPGTHS